MAAARARLSKFADADRTQQLVVFVTGADRSGLRRADLAARTGWRDEAIEEATRQAVADNAIIDADGVLLGRERFDELKHLVLGEIATHHQREPLLRGLAKEILRERFFAHAPAELFRGVLANLEKEGALVAEKEIVRLREHTRELSNEDSGLRARLEKIYRDAGLAAPSLNEALASSGASVQQGRKILQLLIDSGMLVKVHGEMFFYRTALDDLTRRLREHGAKQTDRAIDVAAFKELAGISRKYAIPLLEYFDRQRVTRREGDRRIIL
jgi:selenocysteine-specific elongation factor